MLQDAYLLDWYIDMQKRSTGADFCNVVCTSVHFQDLLRKLMQMKTDRRLCTREDRRYAQQFVKPRDRDCYDDAVHCCASEFVEVPAL